MQPMPAPSVQPLVSLAEQSRFERAVDAPAKHAANDPAAVVARLLARHCAGYREGTGSTVYRYLLGPPTPDGPGSNIDWTVRSLLSCCVPMDLIDLLGACQIPVKQIAAHVRALGVTSQPNIHCLNQFAPGGPGAEASTKPESTM